MKMNLEFDEDKKGEEEWSPRMRSRDFGSADCSLSMKKADLRENAKVKDGKDKI
jgi:hypothetical protein